jgi:O-antigen/teichoic acid export membrane protein
MLVRFIKNSLSVLASQLLLLLSSLGVYVLIGRRLGPDELGQFSFVLAYIGLFSFLPDLGINLYLIREITRKKETSQKYLGTAFTVVFLLIPFVTGIIIVISYLLSLEQWVLKSIYIGMVYLFLGTFISIFRAVFHAFEHMEYETYSVIVERLITFVGCLVVLLAGGGLLDLIAIHGLARLCAFLFSAGIYLNKFGNLPRLSFDFPFAREMVKGAFPFALNVFTTSIYIQADLVLLTLWVGNETSGYYKAATSLIIPLAVIATAVNSAIFPRMARAFTTSTDDVKKLAEASIRYLFMIGWPIALGIWLIARPIITELYGDNFQASILPLKILAFLVPMRFINNSMGTTLTASNQQGTRATIIFLSALLNLGLNLFMIPSWSYIGASVSTMITEVFILISLYLSTVKSLGRMDMWKLINRSFIGGLVMYGIAYFIRDINLVLTIVVAGSIYGFILIALRAFPREDIGQIISVFQSRWKTNQS